VVSRWSPSLCDGDGDGDGDVRFLAGGRAGGRARRVWTGMQTCMQDTGLSYSCGCGVWDGIGRWSFPSRGVCKLERKSY
jgi:hypothetical protein